FLDDAPGDAVDLLRGSARPGRLEGCLLSSADDLVNFANLRRRLAYRDGAGDVRAVPAGAAPEVEDDDVTVDDHPPARLVMGRRAVRTGADDPEQRLVAPRVGQVFPERTGHVGLAATGHRFLGGPIERLVGAAGRPAELVDLTLVLLGPKLR